jgi:hypothetical protein
MMSGQDRRDADRVDFPVLVQFRAQASDGYASGYGADLSTSGLRVQGTPAAVGTTLDLQLVERGGRRPIEVLGEVVRADADGFSVRFVELDEEQRRWLASVVERRSAGDMRAETEDLLETGFEDT